MKDASKSQSPETATKSFRSRWGSLPFVLFLAVLSGIHVANNHRVEAKLKEYDADQEVLDELRWNYLNEKSEFMQESTLSAVSSSVDTLGLSVPNEPLEKINISSHE